MRRIRRQTIPLLACVLVMTFGVSADAQSVVVKAARLIDGRGGPPLEPAMVRITGDRIEEVSKALAVPPGATVMPGPRMFVAGNYVSSTGGAGDARQFSMYVDVPIVRSAWLPMRP